MYKRQEWKLKRGTAGAALKTIDELRSASGKSRLHLALEKMDQAVRKAGVLPEDRLLICSDGLFTPDSAASLESEKRRFQGLLKKMVQRFYSSACFIRYQNEACGVGFRIWRILRKYN